MRIRSALKGRNKILDHKPVLPLQGVAILNTRSNSQAVPWAGMSLPLRGEIQEAQLQNLLGPPHLGSALETGRSTGGASGQIPRSIALLASRNSGA